MKKLLLASTALVLSAGVAAADVSLSGDGWMGVQRDSSNNFNLISRARVTFTLSGETDTGLGFGGSFRADNAGPAARGQGGSVYIEGEFGKLSMGDVDSAAQATMFNTPHIGVLENNQDSRIDTLGSGPNPSALYEYSLDGFGVALSVGNTNSGNQQAAIGASYSFDGFGVGIGYEYQENGDDHILVSGQATFEGITATGFFGRLGDNDQFGVAVEAGFDEIGVQARARRDFAGNDHLGLGVTYDLGGGATMGASANRVTGLGTTADAGIAFSF
ncbi:MAG: porin [Natronohydrobacter sp.]|nr:porin [Natronohydrobacter sp.]